MSSDNTNTVTQAFDGYESEFAVQNNDFRAPQYTEEQKHRYDQAQAQAQQFRQQFAPEKPKQTINPIILYTENKDSKFFAAMTKHMIGKDNCYMIQSNNGARWLPVTDLTKPAELCVVSDTVVYFLFGHYCLKISIRNDITNAALNNKIVTSIKMNVGSCKNPRFEKYSLINDAGVRYIRSNLKLSPHLSSLEGEVEMIGNKYIEASIQQVAILNTFFTEAFECVHGVYCQKYPQFNLDGVKNYVTWRHRKNVRTDSQVVALQRNVMAESKSSAADNLTKAITANLSSENNNVVSTDYSNRAVQTNKEAYETAKTTTEKMGYTWDGMPAFDELMKMTWLELGVEYNKLKEKDDPNWAVAKAMIGILMENAIKKETFGKESVDLAGEIQMALLSAAVMQQVKEGKIAAAKFKHGNKEIYVISEKFAAYVVNANKSALAASRKKTRIMPGSKQAAQQ